MADPVAMPTFVEDLSNEDDGAMTEIDEGEEDGALNEIAEGKDGVLNDIYEGDDGAVSGIDIWDTSDEDEKKLSTEDAAVVLRWPRHLLRDQPTSKGRQKHLYLENVGILNDDYKQAVSVDD